MSNLIRIPGSDVVVDASSTRPAGDIYDRVAKTLDGDRATIIDALEELRRGGLSVQTYADEALVARALVALGLVPDPGSAYALGHAQKVEAARDLIADAG